MDANDAIIRARLAIAALAEIKEAAHAFDEGEVNVFAALASIIATCDDYRERTWRRPEAA
jgi:hypothetical protein